MRPTRRLKMRRIYGWWRGGDIDYDYDLSFALWKLWSIHQVGPYQVTNLCNSSSSGKGSGSFKLMAHVKRVKRAIPKLQSGVSYIWGHHSQANVPYQRSANIWTLGQMQKVGNIALHWMVVAALIRRYFICTDALKAVHSIHSVMHKAEVAHSAMQALYVAIVLQSV